MKIIKLSDNREMVSAAAEWFSSKWNVPKEAYKESMEASFSATVPSWYLCLDDDRIVAGMLLDFVCCDMASHGIGTLYLLTNHTGFYERYGWEYLCPATGDGEDEPSRMYVHRA